MTKAGRFVTVVIIILACFTPMGFHTFSLLTAVIYFIGDKRRKRLLSLIFKS